jgi:4-hydroxy-tetrahydrodipicolinate synthase
MLKQILYTACVTPFDEAGDNVDYDSLEKLLLLQESSGNGVLLLGSTGEGLSLSNEEKKEIVTFACELKLDVEIIVAVPGHNLSAALEIIDFCNDFPIHGYLMTTPIYTKPGVIGQVKWFEKLLDRAAHPAMLYNIPGRASVPLYPEAVRNLQEHKQFVAIKDSSGTVESIVDYKIVAPHVSVYCGDDYMMPSAAIEGAVGLISVSSNAWPVATRKYVKNSIEGKKIESKIWWQACRDLFTASNPIPIKALLKDIGIIKNDVVRLPLHLSDLPSREVLLSHHNIIKNWEDAHE